MRINEFANRVNLDEVTHSSGYAKAQNSGRFGASGSTISFEKRMSIDRRNSIIRGYEDSALSRQGYNRKQEVTDSFRKNKNIQKKERYGEGNRRSSSLNTNEIDAGTKRRLYKFGSEADKDILLKADSMPPSRSSGGSKSSFYNFRPKNDF